MLPEHRWVHSACMKITLEQFWKDNCITPIPHFCAGLFALLWALLGFQDFFYGAVGGLQECCFEESCKPAALLHEFSFNLWAQFMEGTGQHFWLELLKFTVFVENFIIVFIFFAENMYRSKILILQTRNNFEWFLFEAVLRYINSISLAFVILEVSTNLNKKIGDILSISGKSLWLVVKNRASNCTVR